MAPMSMVQKVGSQRVQGQCRELKVAKLCSWEDTSYSLLV